MSFIQALFLGALQGITEFLPVSSSGHLVVMRHFMGLVEIPILFDVLLHLSTLIVVLIVFRKPLISLLLSLGRFIARKNGEQDRENLKLVLIIVIATVPTVLLGLGISVLEMETHPKMISALFMVTGAILIIAHFARGEKDYGKIGAKEGILTGIAQGLGVFPGISRSGITISASLLVGLKREKAGEYSFLIAIPAIIGAFVFELKDMNELMVSVNPVALITGILSSFIVGLVSLLFLLRLVRKGKLYFFSFYLIPLGIIGIILL
jgi:undecaprenyl-diphosphatase